MATPLTANGHIPLIIMGGHWTASYKPDNSDLSRICHAGFTHIFSYYTEAGFIDVTLDNAINAAVDFSSTVKQNCPALNIVMGIPRRWIYDEHLDLIKNYVLGLKANNIAVDYWMTDEMMHQMVDKGLPLIDAERRARAAINAVKQVSIAPYIWIEPGNYNPKLSAILDVLKDLPAGVKSYDEYIISRTGRLSKSRAAFNSMLNTLKRLKSTGNVVFPVCEINYDKMKKVAPTESELAAIAISALMEGADGLIFYEERWTTPEILANFTRIARLINYLDSIGVKRFVRNHDDIASWENITDKKTIRVLLNTSDANLPLVELLPGHSTIVWPSEGVFKELRQMELLVYVSEKIDPLLEQNLNPSR